MKKVLAFLLLILPAPVAFSQKMTYVQMETGPQWNLTRVTDPGEYFEPASLRSSLGGVTVSQEVLRDFTVTTGLYYQPARTGFNLADDRPHQHRVSSYGAFLIPLRAEYRVQLSEFPVSLIPRAGYIVGFYTQPASPYTASGILTAPDRATLTYQAQETFDASSIHMLETGLGVGLRFYQKWQAILNLSYLVGFTDLTSTSLEYQVQGTPNRTATYHSKGSTVMTTLALQMPFSHIWQRREYRIRKRIEGSVYEGKPLERRGVIYVGAELGSLWRGFGSTDPAIGARPMTGRGLFRYANLHTGAYAGYMLTPELGIDIGAYYQRSSTFFSLMYDHEVDDVQKLPAPMFLEVPVRVRYFYDLHEQEIFYVVYGGASLLTHFASDQFGTGSGAFSYSSPPGGSTQTGQYDYVAGRIGRFRPVMRIGTGVEAALPTRMGLVATLYVNYMHGFVGADKIDITTTIPGDPAVSTISYNGSGWSVDLGIKLPLLFGDRPNYSTPPAQTGRQ